MFCFNRVLLLFSGKTNLQIISLRTYGGGGVYRQLSKCMCSQEVLGAMYPGTHKGGKAVSHSVRYVTGYLAERIKNNF